MALVCEPTSVTASDIDITDLTVCERGGIAFEIDIKDPTAAAVATPVRARLEKEAATAEKPLPRLLRAACDTAAPGTGESPQKVIAERARARNEKRQAVVERVRLDFDGLLELKRAKLVSCLERATQSRQTSLKDRSVRAGKHFEDVKAKVGRVQQQQAEAAAEQQRRLEDDLAQKKALQSAGIAERSAKAGKHFEDVKAKVDQVQQRQQAETVAKQQGRFEASLAPNGAAQSAGVAERSAKAGKHFEQVKAKVCEVQRERADAAAEQQRQLESSLAQRVTAHSASVAERAGRAGQHNGRVADKVQRHQEQTQQRLERLREQQQAAQLKADENREKHLHKVASPSRAGGDAAGTAPASPSGRGMGCVIA